MDSGSHWSRGSRRSWLCCKTSIALTDPFPSLAYDLKSYYHSLMVSSWHNSGLPYHLTNSKNPLKKEKKKAPYFNYSKQCTSYKNKKERLTFRQRWYRLGFLIEFFDASAYISEQQGFHIRMPRFFYLKKPHTRPVWRKTLDLQLLVSLLYKNNER